METNPEYHSRIWPDRDSFLIQQKKERLDEVALFDLNSGPKAYFFLIVLNLKGKYSGQKAKILVNKKITASIPKTNPRVPEIVPVKYRTATTAAKANRITRSAELMFFLSFILYLQ